MKTTTSTVGKDRSNAGGFTYVVILAAVAIVGLMAGVTTTLTSRETLADREAELLYRGLAYRNAIKSYYEAGVAVKTFPRSLDDLLKDPRFPRKHHIRALYPDPMSKDIKQKPSWALITAPDGGISGVASISTREPLKQANFPKELEKFGGATSYSEWVFEYVPAMLPPKPVTPTADNLPTTVPQTPATK